MRQFKVGDRVTFDPGSKHHVAATVYEVVAVVPREDNVNGYIYRIKSTKEATIRVAPEDQLMPFATNVDRR